MFLQSSKHQSSGVIFLFVKSLNISKIFNKILSEKVEFIISKIILFGRFKFWAFTCEKWKKLYFTDKEIQIQSYFFENHFLVLSLVSLEALFGFSERKKEWEDRGGDNPSREINVCLSEIENLVNF